MVPSREGLEALLLQFMENLYYPDAGEGGGRYIHIHLVYILWLWQIGDHNETDAVFSTTYTSAAVPFNPCFLVAQMLNFASRITEKAERKNFRFQDLKNVTGIFFGILNESEKIWW